MHFVLAFVLLFIIAAGIGLETARGLGKLGIAVVIGVIGYRVLRSDGRAGPAEATALLPKGGWIVQTAVAGDRIVVTIDVGGTVEIHTFDAATLRPAGRLRFAVEP